MTPRRTDTKQRIHVSSVKGEPSPAPDRQPNADGGCPLDTCTTLTPQGEPGQGGASMHVPDWARLSLPGTSELLSADHGERPARQAPARATTRAARKEELINRYSASVVACILSLAACGGSPTPTPDAFATLVAVRMVTEAAMTAEAPTVTATPRTTPSVPTLLTSLSEQTVAPGLDQATGTN
jgi:hypothetical protein